MTLPKVTITGNARVEVDGHKTLLLDFDAGLCQYLEQHDDGESQSMAIPDSFLLGLASAAVFE